MLLFCRISAGIRDLITKRVVEFDHFYQAQRTFFMEHKVNSVYEEAVYALNGLQSNSVVLQKAREERSAKAYKNLVDTERHLKTLGVKLEDLDALNIIHVAGTKGKGSTCAFSESILRKHGYKTGFYSSPHLISANERIRINGKPISKDAFAKYFWEVYRPVQLSLKDGESMPPYFLFLTVMAFYVFVKEQVEAAVLEVGVGGLWDCTNIVRKPVAVGISTLGIDHVSILGTTIPEIAEQKAGIFKPNVPAFTVPQPEGAMRVLCKKAHAVKCPLLLSPPLEAYEKTICLGMQGAVQNINASLALQLTNTQSVLRILYFNCTGERKAESLLDPLADICFDLVIFSPNRINVMKDASSDLSNFMVDPEKEIQQCVINKEIWCHLMRSLYENELSISSGNASSIGSELRTKATVNDNALQFPSISNALDFIFSSESLNKAHSSDISSALYDLVKNADHIQVLVTGSLHLVGGVLSLIDT
ncbi:folylpolyglutamate synthase, mitochondrial [Trichonephila inaurata madagascariensis]|uniref:Folylpolyglutamate synthase, mitochondrial n=1 Tax=Trichonephila inaurata madagascariensis TaxID=2747483 RepID=A0A8X6ICQ9_9ARAC|nr:folylpolyglutamate synthase, mitochondrial [Trichonephila inaurata madagascariensis]